MPTYDYGCDACGAQWELEQRITADPIKKCPKCGKMKAKRLITTGGNFILKGGGWYSDLYSSPNPASKMASPSSDVSSSSSSESSSSSSESKPTEKASPKKAAKKAAKD